MKNILHSRLRPIFLLLPVLIGLCSIIVFFAMALPEQTPGCDARNSAACTSVCTNWEHQCTDRAEGRWVCTESIIIYYDDGSTAEMCIGGYEYQEGPCNAWEDVCVSWSEQCDSWVSCTGGNCPNGLECQGTCGSGANCRCKGGSGGCQTAADCGGIPDCPYSQQGGSVWSCQANACIAICGTSSSSSSAASTSSSVGPTATRPAPTATPIVTPTPIPQPLCPPDPENYGGTVTRTRVDPPGVVINTQPANPIVVGQDPTKRGVDLNAVITVNACTLDWHYRVQEDYVWCGKASCDCTKDNCEIRQRWKEWDQTCTEPYPIAGVTIRGDLAADSVTYINGPMQSKYPGVKVQQGTLTFFPNSLARVISYIVDNPTTWSMQGLKYPLQDPGTWDVTVNIATQATTHCGPAQWTVPFPKKIPVNLREQNLTR
ncbi:MAG: hypothetical protein HZB51_15400 [Chloroflexi bacterium]|nr:hypothetical protein [Chloroflexota bacterium]